MTVVALSSDAPLGTACHSSLPAPSLHDTSTNTGPSVARPFVQTVVRTNAYATRPPHLATTPAATSPRGSPPPPPPPPPPRPLAAFPSSSWRRSRGNAVPGTARPRCPSSRPCHSSRRSAARSSTIGSFRRPRPPWATRTSVRVVLTEWARVPFVTSPTHGIHVYPLCYAATLLTAARLVSNAS